MRLERIVEPLAGPLQSGWKAFRMHGTRGRRSSELVRQRDLLVEHVTAEGHAPADLAYVMSARGESAGG